MEGMEPRLLCGVTVVLNIAAFLSRYCRVVLGEGFGSKYKPYLAEEFARCSAWIIGLFFVVFRQISGLQRFLGLLGKLKMVGTVSFLSRSSQSLKEGPNKTPYRNNLFETVFDKVFCANECFIRERKAILYIL